MWEVDYLISCSIIGRHERKECLIMQVETKIRMTDAPCGKQATDLLAGKVCVDPGYRGGSCGLIDSQTVHCPVKGWDKVRVQCVDR